LPPLPQVLPSHRVVLVEGNYLLLDEQPWAELGSLFDDVWFVDAPVDVAMERLLQRQVGWEACAAAACLPACLPCRWVAAPPLGALQVSIGLAPEMSKERIAGNDRPNALQVEGTKHRAKVLVPSTVPLSTA
jgi:hypothetical protein